MSNECCGHPKVEHRDEHTCVRSDEHITISTFEAARCLGCMVENLTAVRERPWWKRVLGIGVWNTDYFHAYRASSGEPEEATP